MSFSFKLEVPPSACLLSIPNSNVKARSSNVTLLSPSNHKVGTGLRSVYPRSYAVNETSPQFQVKTLIDLVRGYADKGSIKQVKTVHGVALRFNFPNEQLLVLLNHVAHIYSKCSDFEAACQVVDTMSQKNIFSWTVLIVGSTENGFFLDGFKYFCEMLNHGTLPDKFAYSAIIQSCIGLDCVELGKMVHAQIVIRGFLSHIFVSTSLLNMYSKFGQIEDSCQLFSSMTEHNQVSWNAMISGFTSNGHHLEAFNCFRSMKEEGVEPNIYSLISVSKAVGKLGDIGKCKEVHKFVSELNLESNVLVGTSLIDMYSKCRLLHDARLVFDSNFSCCAVNTPWNSMISGYSQCGYNQEALELYIRMCQNGVKSDLYTYCSMFNSIAALKSMPFGKEVHGLVLKFGYDMMVTSVYNAICDMYTKCGSLEDVRKVFNSMEERDIVSWTTLISAYSQSSEFQEALVSFSEMREDGFTPNQFTFSSVLVACASLCCFEYSRQIHGLLCKAGLDSDLCIESGLIDMYAKCGSMTEARKVFERISNSDIVSWTAIISGYAQHGQVDDALKLFRRMDQLGMKANAVTLLCVLFACSHGGMVNEGLYYFKTMEERYGLVPEMEHYACIVDLLGRVGRLNDAMTFIEQIPMEPNEMVWQTLLGACRVHGNVQLGEFAAQKIFSTRPEYAATYVLLSNTYIEAGSCEDGLSLRDVMKERGVKKEPGYSWIFVEGRVHKFYAGDQQHPLKDEIFAKLEDLAMKIKCLNYIPS